MIDAKPFKNEAFLIRNHVILNTGLAPIVPKRRKKIAPIENMNEAHIEARI